RWPRTLPFVALRELRLTGTSCALCQCRTKPHVSGRVLQQAIARVSLRRGPNCPARLTKACEPTLPKNGRLWPSTWALGWLQPASARAHGHTNGTDRSCACTLSRLSAVPS